MVLLCVIAVVALHRKMLLSWEIVQSHSDTDSIQELFDSTLVPMFSEPSNSTEVLRVSIAIFNTFHANFSLIRMSFFTMHVTFYSSQTLEEFKVAH